MYTLRPRTARRMPCFGRLVRVVRTYKRKESNEQKRIDVLGDKCKFSHDTIPLTKSKLIVDYYWRCIINN
ncbi:hypothetical protein CsSME_00024789 [Camellia sinensis var. sinensis]